MITKLTGNETAQDFTWDLRERINNMVPYDDDVPDMLLPLEPYVKVEVVDEDFTNYRAFKAEDGDWIIPIATYVDGGRTSYTMFDECVIWSQIYDVDNVYVGVISGLMPEEKVL